MGCGPPATVGYGEESAYDSCAVGGLVHQAIRAESENRIVAEVESKSVIRLIQLIGNR